MAMAATIESSVDAELAVVLTEPMAFLHVYSQLKTFTNEKNNKMARNALA